MKKILVTVIVLSLVGVVSHADNVFVYVRFNPLEGNASAVVNDIDNYYQNNNKVIVYIYNPTKAIVAKDKEEWADAKFKLLAMQTAEDYYAEDDVKGLFSIWNELFEDEIDESGDIVGYSDKKWSCVFYLSQKCYNNEKNNESLCLAILSEEIIKRMPMFFKSYNDSVSVEEKNIPNNNIFQY